MKDHKKKSIKQDFYKEIAKQRAERAIIQAEGKRDKEPHLLKVSRALDDYFILEKLNTYCAYLSYQLMVHDQVIGYQETAFDLMEAIFGLLKSKSDWHPAIMIYDQLIQLFEQVDSQDQGWDQLLAIEKQIVEQEQLFSRGDLVELYSYLTNYATYQMNRGNSRFLIKNIVYNQKLIDQEEVASPATINPGAYKNMVLLILKTAELGKQDRNTLLAEKGFDDRFAWAHHFATYHKERLPELDREKYHDYCQALILFYERKIPEAFELLRPLNRVREMFVNFDIKILRLQLLMELEILGDENAEEEVNRMNDEIEAFRSMLSYDKNKNPKLSYQLAYFQTFFNLFKQFYAFYSEFAWVSGYISDRHRKKKAKLEAALSECSFSYRNWFVEKLKAIQ